MSFDRENFTGLAKGASRYAPPDSAAVFTYEYGTTLESSLFQGGSHPCAAPDDLGGGTHDVDCPDPASDPSFVVGLDAFTSLAGSTDGINPPPGEPPVPITYGVDIPPADFVTLRIETVELDELAGYSVGCRTLDAGGGCGDGPDPNYQMYFDGPGTFVVDPGGTHDGFTGHDLRGYLKRSSVAYTSDPANTASDYLWPVEEVSSVGWHAELDLHRAALSSGSVVLIIRPFWKPTASQCLV